MGAAFFMEEKMADEERTEAVETQEEQQGQEEQTVTAEQFAELQRQLEETRKAQSGSDKMVQELKKQLEQKEQEAKQAEQTAEEKWQERLETLETKYAEAERQAKVANQRNLATKLLSEEGLKAPGFLDRLIGENEEETQTAVQEYIEDRKQARLEERDQHARASGRKVTDTKQPTGGTLNDYTDDQINDMSDEEFLRVMERSKQ